MKTTTKKALEGAILQLPEINLLMRGKSTPQKLLKAVRKLILQCGVPGAFTVQVRTKPNHN